ncbi:hypothetical protein VIGAN_02222400 [Vigna angularis var. angularis]|uniref:Uncharacterized protein n=1 Tax=Vigna angularis var. angularis TaxID=157739 RepID=A0A0S3RFZ6_PHAAN|nr:hypothetical protein VIGAN_02222400 [Vigna angularis var. angularis]
MRERKKREDFMTALNRRLDQIGKVRTSEVKVDDRCGARKAFTMVSVHRNAAINDLALHSSNQRAITVARDNCLAVVNFVRGRCN